ncbi:hypothetical protein GCM10011498_33850 [Amylibacter cionae]|uniref:Uncharacterized protein n=1 Tax=Neptunicoccus cionae TaxID=2035344 RepID=A0A916R302_9RHOB|nr:hypothetical protein GCM10011498_33850 [Amylibacter cionae]
MPSVTYEQQLLAHLAQHPWQTTEEIHKNVKMPLIATNNTVHSLLRAGLIERYEYDRTIVSGLPCKPLLDPRFVRLD